LDVTTIEVEEIRKLAVRPGETLVVTVAASTSVEMASRIHEILIERLPDGVDVIVMAGHVELNVVSADDVARL
jgi:hypothetical protein